ncbi:MAG: DUF1428 domain-containing protein [Sphingobium sp.]
MIYVDGFLVPVPGDKKDAYVAMAEKATPLFIEYGALRVVETWGDDVKRGKTNDFYTAVIAEDGEEAVFSWIEWPDKATRDAAWEKMMADDRMKPDGDMPFSGARMIYGGFAALVDQAPAK